MTFKKVFLRKILILGESYMFLHYEQSYSLKKRYTYDFSLFFHDYELSFNAVLSQCLPTTMT